MSPTETRTTWQSIKTLVSPQTIPFLIGQGVLPRLFPVGTLLIGLILGFVWAYGISPTVNTAADPVHLNDSAKQEWVKQTAWQLNASGDTKNAKTQLDTLGNAGDVLDRMIANNSDPTIAPKLQALKDQGLAVNNPAELAKISPGLLNGNFTPVLCVLGLAIILGLAVIINTIIPLGSIASSYMRRTAPTKDSGIQAARITAQKSAQAMAAAAPPPPVVAETVSLGDPVGKYISTYIMGDDLYDDSFAIETATNEFLGETGTGISKTIGVGDPKKVTAVEAWVFDKNDIRTLTKVLMSEWAFNDEATRAELAPKGEAVLIKPGAIVILETQTLTIQVRVLNLIYGTGALPANSFFDQLSVEISAWPKKAAASGGPTGTIAAPPPPVIPPPAAALRPTVTTQAAPPPVMPPPQAIQPQAPQQPPQQPSQQPPPNIPDAFGETGPISNPQ